VLQALELVHLEQLWERPATALSGGQQQRVALARSIAYDPTVLLLDEPLSNLDAKLRERMRFELVSLQQRLGVTMIYVTHDQEEAMILGDKIALMLDGNIIQWGTAHELYAEPQSEFAASFFGRSNLISGHLEEVHPKAQEGIVRISGDECVQCRVLADVQEASDVLVCVRPEDVRLVDAAKATDGSSVLAGEITAVAFLGDRYEVKVKLVQTDEELRIYDYATGETRKEGDAVGVALSPHRCIALRTES
jgi:iron(III) transport system ATP-binding protein